MDRRVKLNYAAIVVATVVYWLIQAGWYTVLGKQWLAAVGKTVAELQQHGNSPIPYIVSFVCDLIVACVLAWILARIGEPSVVKGAVLGAILALGIVATALMTQYLFEQRTLALFLINSGGALVGFVVMGTIVGAWKVKAPKTTTAAA